MRSGRNQKMGMELIGSIELIEQGKSHSKSLSYDTSHEMFYIEYGMKNGDQVYGGATINIRVNSLKPCFVPVYIDNNLAGTIYIYNNTSTKQIVAYNYDISDTILIRVYAYA